MRIPSDTHERLKAVSDLLGQDVLSISAFESVRRLLKGVSPILDDKLEVCSQAFEVVQKLQTGDIISLSAENIPATSEKEKKRKKALLLFLNSVKDLRSEINRLQKELSTQQNSSQSQIVSWGKIVRFAKGPFGLVTLVALIIVIALPFFSHRSVSNPSQIITPTQIATSKMQIIVYQSKQLPLNQLYIGHGADCDSPHYHAITGKVTALDGTIVVDPEGCGFGKVADVQVTTVDQR